MSQLPFALQLLVLIVSGWVNRRQQLAIEYLLEENRVLREQLGNPWCPKTQPGSMSIVQCGSVPGHSAASSVENRQLHACS